MVYTDEHPSYRSLPNHEAVRHSAREYVDGMAHVNGMESFWTTLKRGYHRTYHLPDTHKEFGGLVASCQSLPQGGNRL